MPKSKPPKHIQQCIDLIIEEAGENNDKQSLLEAGARLLSVEMGLEAIREPVLPKEEMSDRVLRNRWSITRQMLYNLEIGKARIFPPNEINNAKTSIQRLRDAFGMCYRQRRIGSSLKVKRIK